MYALETVSLLSWTVRVAIETETNMTAVERLAHYARTPPEAAEFTGHLGSEGYGDGASGSGAGGAGTSATTNSTATADAITAAKATAAITAITSTATSAKAWPSKGTVSFTDVTMRYRPGLELVLRGMSLDVVGGEKLGICGRTGAGTGTHVACASASASASVYTCCGCPGREWPCRAAARLLIR